MLQRESQLSGALLAMVQSRAADHQGTFQTISKGSLPEGERGSAARSIQGSLQMLCGNKATFDCRI